MSLHINRLTDEQKEIYAMSAYDTAVRLLAESQLILEQRGCSPAPHITQTTYEHFQKMTDFDQLCEDIADQYDFIKEHQ